MHDTKLYHGTVMLFDVERGAEVNVAVQVHIGSRRLAYTIKSLVCDRPPVTIVSDDPDAFALLTDLLERMHQVSVPA